MTDIVIVDASKTPIEVSFTVAQGLSGAVSNDLFMFSIIAPSNFGGQRIIAFNGTNYFYASYLTPLDSIKTIGISKNAASVGTELKIQTLGNLTDPSFTWDIGTILYLGDNGLLTNIPPTTGLFWELAKVVYQNTICFNPKNPIIR